MSELKTFTNFKYNLPNLPENVFNGLAELLVLIFDGKNLITLPENVFQCLTELTVIALDDNRLATLPENIFKYQTNDARKYF